MKNLRRVFMVLAGLGYLLSTAFFIYMAIDLFYKVEPNEEPFSIILMILIAIGYGTIFYGATALLGLISLIITIRLKKSSIDVDRRLPITLFVLPIVTEAILAIIVFAIGLA